MKRSFNQWHRHFLLSFMLLAALFGGLFTGCDSTAGGGGRNETIPPETVAVEDAYQMCYNTSFTGHNDMPVSGWRYDNRGGAVMTESGGGTGILNDISDEYGVALIREFNLTKTGKIVTETSLEARGEGVYLEYRDGEDKPLYRLSLKDDAWKLLLADGSEKTLADGVMNGKGSVNFRFRITLDMDKGTSETFIDDVNCGTEPLLSDSLLNFRFATEDKAKTVGIPGAINIVANYPMYEDFTQFGVGELYGWTSEGSVSVTNGELTVGKDSRAQKTFDAIGGKVCAETWVLFKNEGEWNYSLGAGEKTAVTVTAKDGAFWVGDEKLVNASKNMWYRLRVVADGFSGNAEFFVNGRSVGTAPLATVLPIDSVTVETLEAKVSMDMMKICGLVEHEDYVPAPAVKANFDDYVVGLNICSLWREGHHWGWTCISPYNEPEPVLGYYDEGVPETADWEIKYMVEHGIDYQAFCWYADVSSGPLKNPRMSEHLHDGFMYAKYSDYMKYTLIWEASNGKHFNSQQFRTNVVPYWFENYFLDDRYLKLDNKIVLQIFGQDNLNDETYFGSVAGTKAEFDYLRDVAKSYGFDGVIIIGCSSRANNTYYQMGIDAVSAYNWGNAGKSREVNKSNILASARSADKVYTIPTISVGFDSIPWHGIRYGMMTVEDYAAAHTWVKNEYLPKYGTDETIVKGAWNDKLVMLSTWNEYGEGTYIMPCENLNGFGYLDVLRDTYTDYGAAGTEVDLIPTAAQRERINHLFPQYTHILRAQGWYALNGAAAKDYVPVLTLNFDASKISTTRINDMKIEDGVLTGVTDAENNDSIVGFKGSPDLPLEGVTAVRITMQAPSGTQPAIYFATDGETGLSESKTIKFVTDTDDMKEYVIPIDNALWTGTLIQVRFDPSTACSTPITLKSIEFLKETEAERPSLSFNGLPGESKIAGEEIGDDIAFPFDPGAAYDLLINSFYTWDKANGRLIIEANHHKVILTVDSDVMEADGKNVTLPFKVYTVDGLPMISFKALSEVLGFTYEREGLACSIITPAHDVFESMQNRTAGDWEFEGQDTEGWNSSSMALMTENGVLTMTSIDQNTDPILRNSSYEPMEAADFNTFEVRCKYDYSSGSVQMLVIYFITNQDQTWNEAKTIKIPLSAFKTDTWEEYSFDLAEQPLWADIITDIRFDPFNATGEMQVDYLRFVNK